MFSFEGGPVILISPVPGHCLPFTFYYVKVGFCGRLIYKDVLLLVECRKDKQKHTTNYITTYSEFFIIYFLI